MDGWTSAEKAEWLAAHARPRLVAVAARICGPDLAEDAVHDALLAVWRGGGAPSSAPELTAYATTAVRRHALRYLGEGAGSADAAARDRVAPPLEEQAAARALVGAWFRSLAERVPEAEARSTLRLEAAGLSYGEIAQRRSLPLRRIRWHVERYRREVREHSRALAGRDGVLAGLVARLGALASPPAIASGVGAAAMLSAVALHPARPPVHAAAVVAQGAPGVATARGGTPAHAVPAEGPRSVPRRHRAHTAPTTRARTRRQRQRPVASERARLPRRPPGALQPTLCQSAGLCR